MKIKTISKLLSFGVISIGLVCGSMQTMAETKVVVVPMGADAANFTIVSQTYGPFNLGGGMTSGIGRTLECPSGMSIAGGGLRNSTFKVVVIENGPSGTTGWKGWTMNASPSAIDNVSLTITAICTNGNVTALDPIAPDAISAKDNTAKVDDISVMK